MFDFIFLFELSLSQFKLEKLQTMKIRLKFQKMCLKLQIIPRIEVVQYEIESGFNNLQRIEFFFWNHFRFQILSISCIICQT